MKLKLLSIAAAMMLAWPAAAQQGATVNPVTGSIWTYFGPTYGAGWAVPSGGGGSGFVPGVVGDGATDNCAALQGYLALGTSPLTIFLPAGTFLSSCEIYVTGKSVSIRGLGSAATELRFTGATNGFRIDTSAQKMVNVADIAITTTRANLNSAVKVSYTVSGFNDRDVAKLKVRDVLIKGADQKTQSWNKCLDLLDVNNVRVDGLECFGIQGPLGTAGQAEAANTVTSYGIYLAGTNYPTDYKILSSMFLSLNKAFSSVNTMTEGLYFTSNTFVNVGTGVEWIVAPSGQGRPQLTFIGNHINAYSSCIKLSGVAESTISDNLFYHSPGATSEQFCVNLTNTNAVSVNNNQFENFSSAPTTGVLVFNDTGTYSTPPYLVKIAGNLFGSESSTYPIGIFINTNVPQTFASDNRFGPNVGVKITDNSGVSPGQQTAFGRHYIQVKRGGSAQSIPSGVTTLVSWDAIDYQTLGWTFTVPSTYIAIPASQPTMRIKCAAAVQFDANATGYRTVRFLKNGVGGLGLPVSQRPTSMPGGVTTDISMATGIISVVGNDTISLEVSQNSGAALNLNQQYTWLTCEMVE
jgi:hypothetical protein